MRFTNKTITEKEDDPLKKGGVFRSPYLPKDTVFIFTDPATQMKSLIVPVDISAEVIEKANNLLNQRNDIQRIMNIFRDAVNINIS